MGRFVVRRIISGLIVLWVVITLVFLINYVIPQNPARLFAGRNANYQTVESIRHTLYLDRPLWVQYFHFWDLLIHGQLISFVSHESVFTIIGDALPITMSLLAGGAVVWLVVGLAIGIFSARHPRSLGDRAGTVFALLLYSTPPFVIGLLLLYALFYLPRVNGIDAFPPPGYVPLSDGFFAWAHALVLPWLALGLTSAAAYSRLSRNSLLGVLSEDYIRTARAKGLSERRVIYRHALRSALTPIVSQFGIDTATVFGTAVLTEVVFGLNGIGQLAVRSITITHDLPVVIGIVVVAATFVIVANMIVDIAYTILDPRVRLN